MSKGWKKNSLRISLWFVASTLVTVVLHAQTPKLTLDFTKATTTVSPMLLS